MTSRIVLFSYEMESIYRQVRSYITILNDIFNAIKEFERKILLHKHFNEKCNTLSCFATLSAISNLFSYFTNPEYYILIYP